MKRTDARRIAERARKRADAKISRRAQAREARPKRESINRAEIFARDKGVCAECGVDTEKLRKWLVNLPRMVGRWIVYGKRDRHTLHFTEGARIGRHQARAVVLLGRLWGVRLYRAQHLWEADHVKPVAEGGARLGVDNIRTMCLRCHHFQSEALNARLARRPSKGVGYGF